MKFYSKPSELRSELLDRFIRDVFLSSVAGNVRVLGSPVRGEMVQLSILAVKGLKGFLVRNVSDSDWY